VEEIRGAVYYRGKVHIGVGGGAYTNTFVGRFVLSPDKQLKPCSWIRRHGPLACEVDQALVPLEVGDIVCRASGRLPASPLNPDINLSCVKVEGIREEKVPSPYGGEETIPIPYGKRVKIEPEEVPRSVWDGMNDYHNRSGEYFCSKKVL
jgi:hypothetical protein